MASRSGPARRRFGFPVATAATVSGCRSAGGPAWCGRPRSGPRCSWDTGDRHILAPVSLTNGTAPFGPRPAGSFNRPMPESAGLLFLEPFLPRIRGTVGDVTVVDSTATRMLHEHGQLPVLYFPVADVRMDLLEPNGRRSDSPGKGQAVHYRMTVGDRITEDAGWMFPEAQMPQLAGLIAFYLPSMQAWWQEDEPMPGHARDPYHRIEVLDTSRHIRVLIGDRVVAESSRARALFETGLPVRWYLPVADVAQDLLEDSATRTTCAYKGQARYVSVRTDDGVRADLAWIYDEPLHDAARVAGYVAFWNELVDVEVDGVVESRPETSFFSGVPPVLGLYPPDMLERRRSTGSSAVRPRP